MFYVYKIEINNIIRYYGITNDIKKRTYQHNYHLKKGANKDLYNNIRKINITSINLDEVKIFKKRIDAKRYECLLILTDYFNNQELWQKVPNISDR